MRSMKPRIATIAPVNSASTITNGNAGRISCRRTKLRKQQSPTRNTRFLSMKPGTPHRMSTKPLGTTTALFIRSNAPGAMRGTTGARRKAGRTTPWSWFHTLMRALTPLGSAHEPGKIGACRVLLNGKKRRAAWTGGISRGAMHSTRHFSIVMTWVPSTLDLSANFPPAPARLGCWMPLVRYLNGQVRPAIREGIWSRAAPGTTKDAACAVPPHGMPAHKI